MNFVSLKIILLFQITSKYWSSERTFQLLILVSWNKSISMLFETSRQISVCVLISQTANQNSMRGQGKPLPSWAQTCQVLAWEEFVSWSYKPLKIGVCNGSAILTLSIVALLLCYNISSPSICEIVICPMPGNWGDDETNGHALNCLNLSVLGFYWHTEREGEQRGLKSDSWVP